MCAVGGIEQIPGEINLVNSQGMSLEKFNINTEDGFENLAAKICELSFLNYFFPVIWGFKVD